MTTEQKIKILRVLQEKYGVLKDYDVELADMGDIVWTKPDKNGNRFGNNF